MTSSATRRASTSVEHDGKILRPQAFQRSDAALVRGLRSGRHDATEQLYARYGHEVARLMVALLGPQAQLADVIAEVFDRLVREAKRRDPGALSPKLLRLGVRIARQSVHRPWWRLRPTGRYAVERADVSRLHRKLYQGLGTLPDDERVIYALHFVAGHPVQEVASAVGLSLGAVRRRLARAQASLDLDRHARDFGPEVAAEQADWLQRGDVMVEARERLLSPSAPRRLDAMVVVLLVVVTTILLILWPRTPGPLAFEVGTETPGAPRAWLSVPPGEQLPIRFDDGGEVRLIDGARARVTTADRGHGEMVLERGTIRVEASGRARWTYVVGPFDVVGSGARFEARYRSSAQRMDLAVAQGEVRVTGPDLDEHVVRAGETFAVHATEGVISTH